MKYNFLETASFSERRTETYLRYKFTSMFKLQSMLAKVDHFVSSAVHVTASNKYLIHMN